MDITIEKEARKINERRNFENKKAESPGEIHLLCCVGNRNIFFGDCIGKGGDRVKTLLRKILIELRQIREELEQIKHGLQVIKIRLGPKESLDEISKAINDFIC